MVRVLLLLLVLTCSATGELRVVADRQVDAERLRTLLRAAPSLERFSQDLTESYIREGYFSAVIGIEATPDTAVIISTGRRYVSTDILVVGVDTNVVDRQMLIKDDEPVTAERIGNLTRQIVNSYADAGYPFCQATIGSITVFDDRLELAYEIQTGPLAAFGKTEFIGLVATKPARLLRRLELHSGIPYRESMLRRSQRLLSQLDFTSPTREPIVAHDARNNAADIVFTMRDDRNLTIEGLLYLNSDNTIGGSGELGLLNVFGTGERVNLEWSRLGDDSRDLSLSAGLPYAGGFPVDLQMSAVQSDRDSAFVSGKLRFGATYHAGEQLTMGAAISWEKITPEEGRTSPSARIAGVTLSTSYQDRDDIRATKHGVLLRTDFGSMYRKSFDQGSDVSTGYSTNINASLELWRQIAKRWVVYQRMVPFQIRSDFSPIPKEQLYEIGGPRSLRGYRERSFLANLGITSATELRYVFEREFLARVFCDNGYIETEAGTRKLTGFGIGMELGTTLGKFRLDFSLGESKQLDQMLVHFGFEAGL